MSFFKKFDKDYKYNGNFPYLKDGVWVNRFYYDKYILKTSLRDVACANVMSYVGVELNEVDNKYKNEILSISNTFDDILAKGAIEDAIFKQLNSVLYTASGALKEKIKNGSEAELDKIYRDAIDAAFIAAEKNISEELKDAVNKTLWGYLKDHMKGLIVAAMRGKIDLEKANRVGFKVFIKSMITAYVQVTKLTYSVGAVWKTAAANWSYEKDKKLLDKLVDYHDSGCTTWDGTSFWDKTTGSIELQKYGFLHS